MAAPLTKGSTRYAAKRGAQHGIFSTSRDDSARRRQGLPADAQRDERDYGVRNCALLLQALVPFALVAFTNQPQLAVASVTDGMNEHMPVPAVQPACAGVTAMFTPTPVRF